MSPEEMRVIIDRYIAAYNSFDVEGMLALMCDDVVFENYSGGARNLAAAGVDELRRVGAQTKGVFSSRRQTVTSCEIEGDRATVYIDYEAVLAQDMAKGPKAGERIAFQGRSDITFRDGKIATLIDYA
ncbi:MAG: nuclear transport factor 2 family protein [Deltaproteobacteria bacterium]|jgi:hypothetical protein|nr:nuclear transport factor 2 family protein [Deltaproteobacteria bacterium]